MAMIKCAKCGKSVSDNEKICPYCGEDTKFDFKCPKCGSKDITFAANNKDRAVSGTIPGIGGFLAFSAMASSIDTEITYVCKKCGCKFTNHNQIIRECEAAKPEKYNLFTAYLSMLKKTFKYRGRSRRQEFWLSSLAIFLFIVISIALTLITGSMAIYSLGILITGYHMIALFSMWVRRLHDVGKSGGWMLIGMMPVIGALILYSFAVQDSDYGDNEYGPNPKGLS